MRYMEESTVSTYEASFDKEVIVLLDSTLDTALIQEGLAREIINRVQRLRKKVIILSFYFFKIRN